MQPTCSKFEFNALTQLNFGFLSEFKLQFVGTRIAGRGDLRDETIISRFERPDLRIEIAWMEAFLSLGVRMKYREMELPEASKYVDLERFILFLGSANELPIIPFLDHKMSGLEIERVVENRRSILEMGMDGVLKRLAQKLKQNIAVVESASETDVLGFHEWAKNAV